MEEGSSWEQILDGDHRSISRVIEMWMNIRNANQDPVWSPDCKTDF
jgi:hypothetical protein